MGLAPSEDNIQQEGNPAKSNGNAKKDVKVERFLDELQFRPGDASFI